MFRLTRSKLQPIGLDIGADSIHMMQLEVSGASPVVEAYARQSIPAEARNQPTLALPVACDLIRQMLRQHSFAGRSVVASLPQEMIHVKNLRLPMMPVSELAAAIEFEAKTVFPFDTDKAQIRHIYAGEVRQGSDSRQEVIVLAVKNDDVNDYLEALHRCGAIVEALDFEPCALYRSIERFIRRKEDEQDVNVLIDIGLRRTQVIIGKGRDIHFFKPIEIGGAALNDAVAQKLAISVEEARNLRQRVGQQDADDTQNRDSVRQAVYDATRTLLEELGREISLCLRYYSVTFRGQRPSRVKLVGGEANDPQVLSVLNGALPVPADAGRPLSNVDTSRMKPQDRHGNLSEWATALGLALKQTDQHFAARDGKPRETAKPIEQNASVEVVDLNRAVRSSSTNVPANAVSVTGSSDKEIIHA